MPQMYVSDPKSTSALPAASQQHPCISQLVRQVTWVNDGGLSLLLKSFRTQTDHTGSL